jgi:tetratricopeptide (TPR) repeat protein
MSLIEGASYDFLGYVYPTYNLGTFGLGIGRIGVTDIQWKDNSGFGESTFSNQEYHIYLSYAKRLPYNLTAGATIRFVRRGWSGIEGVGDLVDTGLGADIGVMYKPEWFGSRLYQDWSFGLKIHNFFSPRLNEGLESDEFPLSIRLGLFKKIRFVGGESFDALLDFDYSEKRDMRLHLGTSYKYRDLGELRLGFQSDGLTFGAGVTYNIFQLDYAFGTHEYSEVFSATHRISCSINFGLTRTEMFEVAERERTAEQEQFLAEMRELEKENFIRDHIRLADNYFGQERFIDAIVEYRQVVNRDSTHVYAATMLDSSGTFLQKQVEETQTLAVQEALDKERAQNDLLFIENHYNRGIRNLELNKFQEALIEFNLVLERDRNNRSVAAAIQTTRRRINEEVLRLINETETEMENENFAEALVLINDARGFNSNNVRYTLQLDTLEIQATIQKNLQRGILLYQIKEFEQAYIVFDDVLTMDSTNVEAQEYLERCKIETLGRQVKMAGDVEQLYLQGVNAFLEGDYNRAISIWEQILIEQPYNKKVLMAIQGAKERQKRDTK